MAIGDERDYFAVRAPHDIADWFEPTVAPMPQPPIKPSSNDFVRDLPALKRGAIADALSRITGLQGDEDTAVKEAIAIIEANWPDDGKPFSDELRASLTADLRAYYQASAAYVATSGNYESAAEAWKHERERQRVSQWPWAWADLVLAARDVQMK